MDAHAHLRQATAPDVGLTLLGTLGILLVIAAVAAYMQGVLALQHDGRHWKAGRTAAFLAGCSLLAVGLAPPLMQLASGDFRYHMLQHLLLGMLAPLGLVLGAPASLLLRSLPQRRVRGLSGVLHGRWIHFVAHPLNALLLNVGGMYLLYLSPLYAAMHTSLALHAFVHLHFVLAGCLFTWSMLDGPDPVPRRYPPTFRLAVLTAAIAAHSLLSKLMYAYGWPAGMHPLEQVQAGAQWMYYGGDLAELLLLVALFSRWQRATQTAKMQYRIP